MFKGKVILILGAGYEQLPAYEISKKNSATIIGVDKNKNAPGLKLADYKIITSVRNYKKLISKIKKIGIKISAVLTIANDIPEVHYKICKYFRTKNISKLSSLLASNKIKLYQELKKKNILVPDFFIIKNMYEFKKVINNNHNTDFVLKPCDSRGSRGVNFLNSNSNLRNLFKDSFMDTKKNVLILQKFIKGIQVSSESLILNNKIYTILSYRNYEKVKKFYPSIVENGGDHPLKINVQMRRNIDLLIKKISKILKINQSPLKCDLIISKKKVYVIEATPRFGGGYVASHTSEVIYGVNFLLVYIKILLGNKIKKINFKYKKKFLSIRFMFPHRTGIIKKINCPNFDKFKKNIVHKVFYKKTLSYVSKIKNHADRLVCILVKAQSRKQARIIAEKLTNSYNFIIT